MGVDTFEFNIQKESHIENLGHNIEKNHRMKKKRTKQRNKKNMCITKFVDMNFFVFFFNIILILLHLKLVCSFIDHFLFGDLLFCLILGGDFDFGIF